MFQTRALQDEATLSATWQIMAPKAKQIWLRYKDTLEGAYVAWCKQKIEWIWENPKPFANQSSRTEKALQLLKEDISMKRSEGAWRVQNCILWTFWRSRIPHLSLNQLHQFYQFNHLRTRDVCMRVKDPGLMKIIKCTNINLRWNKMMKELREGCHYWRVNAAHLHIRDLPWSSFQSRYKLWSAVPAADNLYCIGKWHFSPPRIHFLLYSHSQEEKAPRTNGGLEKQHKR